MIEALKENRTNSGKSEHRNMEKDQIEVLIEADLYFRLSKLSRESDLSLYLILLTGLKCLIYRYTLNTTVVVGSPAYKLEGSHDGRNIITALEDEVCGEMTFKDLLLNIRQTTLEAYEKQDCPSNKIASPSGCLGGERSPAFIDTVCLLKNIHFVNEERLVENDMVFSFERAQDSLRLKLYYDCIAFSRDTALQLAGHYISLLAHAVNDINLKLKEIGFITDEEKKRLITDFNSRVSEYPYNKTICRLFEEQATQNPDSIAVEYKGTETTYRELNTKANRLAAELRRKGVRPDSIVGLISEHSPAAVAGMLGVLKAGGAYLPIDPSYNESRVVNMLEDSGSNIVLVTQSTEKKFSFITRHNSGNRQYILLDELYSEDASPYEANPECVNSPQDLAYVIYTSGSTGKPKGVMVTHRGLVNYIWWANRVYVNGERMAFPLYSSLSFDLTVTSIYTPLISGNKIVIYDDDSKTGCIDRIISENKVEIVKLTPTHLRLFEENMRESKIRKFIVGGEDLKTDLAEKVYKAFGERIEIFNEYGPTETVVGCMIHQYNPAKDRRNSVPIGVPADNVRIYVLDECLCPVPVGAVGEIYISGDGVARGYLNRPELTKERFIPDPFSPADSRQWMYKTGDIGVHLSNGLIEYRGRIDHQVKIRGYRVEPGEIENALLKYEPVKEAVIVDREDIDGSKVLCAYHVSVRSLTVQELKEHLADELPDYMIPTYFVQVGSLPLTANGKVDRGALPDPLGNIKTGAEYQAPRDDVEKRLAEVWKDVLGIERIGINDSFFDMGGHSLKATMLMAGIHRVFNVQLPLSELFKTSTIKGLANKIKSMKEDLFSNIEPVKEKEYYPASSAQKRLLMMNTLDPESVSYNTPSAMVLKGNLDHQRFEKAFNMVISRHESLRTSFELIHGEPIQRIHKGVDFKIIYRDTVPDAIDCLIKEFVKKFDLSKPPLFRAMLVKISENKHLLLFDIHHIICDAMSIEVLLYELTCFYNGKDLQMPRIQYRDYAAWHDKFLNTEAIKKQEKYWLEYLKDFVFTKLPVKNRVSADKDRAAKKEMVLERDTMMKIDAFCKHFHVTRFVLFAAVFILLIQKETNQWDISIGTSVSGRRHSDLEGLIGLFLNILVIRVKVDANATVEDYIRQVNDIIIRLQDNQDYPYEELYSKLKRDIGLKHKSLFSIFLNYIPYHEHKDMFLEGVTIEPYTYVDSASKNDATLYVDEHKDSIHLIMEYKSDLHDESTIEAILEGFKKIFNDLMESRNALISEIDTGDAEVFCAPCEDFCNEFENEEFIEVF